MTLNLRRIILAAAISAALLSPALVEAKGGGHAAARHASTYCASCARDGHGKIARSQSATQEFKKETGYPHGRPGYVIDHVVPLKRGGCDCRANLQWQSKADAKAKDRWE